MRSPYIDAVPRSETLVVAPVGATAKERRGADEQCRGSSDYSVLERCVGYMSAGQLLRLLPGQYSLGDTFEVTKAIKLSMRGAYFPFTVAGNTPPLYVHGTGRTGNYRSLAANGMAGTRELTLSGDPSTYFAAGDWAQITDEDTQGDYNDKKAEFVRIRRVDDSTDTVWLSDTLRFNYYTANSARLRQISVLEDVEVEGGKFVGAGPYLSDGYYDGPRYAWLARLKVTDQWIREFSEINMAIVNTMDTQLRNIRSELSARSGFGYGIGMYATNTQVEIIHPQLRDCRHSIMAAGQDSSSYGGPSGIKIHGGFIKAIGLDSYLGSNYNVASIDCHECWADDWWVDAVEFNGCGQLVRTACRSLTVTNCKATGYSKYGFSDRWDTESIMERLVIKNCSLKGSGNITYIEGTALKLLEISDIDIEIVTPYQWNPLICGSSGCFQSNAVVRIKNVSVNGSTDDADVLVFTTTASPKPLVEIENVNTGKSDRCGIRLSGFRGQLKNCRCDNGNQGGSSDDAMSTGIYLASCTDMEVAGCSACDTQGTHTQRRGIYTTGCDYLRLHDNHCEGNTVSQLTKSGSNSKQWLNWPTSITSDTLW